MSVLVKIDLSYEGKKILLQEIVARNCLQEKTASFQPKFSVYLFPISDIDNILHSYLENVTLPSNSMLDLL